MLTRSLLVAAVLMLSAWAVHGGAPSDIDVAARLDGIPLVVGDWTGRDEPRFDEDTLRVLGADDYVNRTYVASGSPAPAALNLYVAYYASQRQGDAIHSPMNCLPGTGWQPVSRGRVAVGQGPSSFEANRVLVQKGRDRQLVLYWYEGRGRRVASEYLNKALLIGDAMRLNRTDGALVRLSIPVHGSKGDSEQRLLAFTAALQPSLADAIPGMTGEQHR